jgi:hypothetical protein
MKFAPLLALLVAAAAAAQTATDVLRGAVHDAALPAEARIGRLVQLQTAGELDVATAVAALAATDVALADAAAAIVRHQWRELPPSLFAALDQQPSAARALLRQLAVAPRPAALAWITTWERASGRTRDERCLALAARGTPFTPDDGKLLLATVAAGEAGDGAAAALSLLPPAVADASIGRLHQLLLQQPQALDAVLPWLDRLSPRGVRHLLGPALTLDRAVAATLLQRIHERAPELVVERVQDALAQASELDPLWLPFLAPLLGEASVRQRVLALLAPGGDEAVRRAAFLVAVEARVIDQPVLDYANETGDGVRERIWPLLDRLGDRLPAAQLLDWLLRDPLSATAVAQALGRRPPAQLDAELERHLLAELRAAATVDGQFLQPVAVALIRGGTPATVAAVWPLVRTSAHAEEFVDALVRRGGSLAHECLSRELSAPAGREPLPATWLDAIELGLVALGDRSGVDRLVRRAAAASPGFVRRCTRHAAPLPPALAHQLLDQVLGPRPPEPSLAAELVTWAATASADPTVAVRLLPLWTEPAADELGSELQDVALRALVRGAERPRLLAELRAALAAGPLPAPLEPLAFELLGSMPTPLGDDDLALLAELLLLQPRTDPEREAELARRWPDGGTGFPLVSAVAQSLRGADPGRVEAVFLAASAAAAGDPRSSTISASRLLVALRTLQAEPPVQRALGAALAPLVAERLPDPSLRAAVAALRLPGLLARGEFAAARPLAELARDWLLGRPEQRGAARMFLGDRDPGAGLDPWAALAAMPYRCELALARLRGDAAAIAAAAAAVREFAGRDAATLADCIPPVPETDR